MANVHLSWCPLSCPISDGKYGSTEYVISGAPSLHASQILSPDLSKFTRPDRPEEVYDNDPRVVRAFKLRPMLLRTIYKKILPHAGTVSRAQAMAVDILAEVWINVIEDIDKFGGKSKFETWLTSIALHKTSDWITALHAQKRGGDEGEVLSDFVAKNNEDELEGDAYPDAKQDQLVGIGSGTRRTFEHRDAFMAFTATAQVMQIDAAIENGEPASPVERRILRDWVLGNLREMQLRYLHRLLPRKTAKVDIKDTFTTKHGQKWSPLKGWEPKSLYVNNLNNDASKTD